MILRRRASKDWEKLITSCQSNMIGESDSIRQALSYSEFKAKVVAEQIGWEKETLKAEEIQAIAGSLKTERE